MYVCMYVVARAPSEGGQCRKVEGGGGTDMWGMLYARYAIGQYARRDGIGTLHGCTGVRWCTIQKAKSEHTQVIKYRIHGATGDKKVH